MIFILLTVCGKSAVGIWVFPDSVASVEGCCLQADNRVVSVQWPNRGCRDAKQMPYSIPAATEAPTVCKAAPLNVWEGGRRGLRVCGAPPQLKPRRGGHAWGLNSRSRPLCQEQGLHGRRRWKLWVQGRLAVAWGAAGLGFCCGLWTANRDFEQGSGQVRSFLKKL